MVTSKYWKNSNLCKERQRFTNLGKISEFLTNFIMGTKVRNYYRHYYLNVNRKKVKERIAVNWTPSHSYGTSLAIWDRTCHPTQVNSARLNSKATRQCTARSRTHDLSITIVRRSNHYTIYGASIRFQGPQAWSYFMDL